MVCQQNVIAPAIRKTRDVPRAVTEASAPRHRVVFTRWPAAKPARHRNNNTTSEPKISLTKPIHTTPGGEKPDWTSWKRYQPKVKCQRPLETSRVADIFNPPSHKIPFLLLVVTSEHVRIQTVAARWRRFWSNMWFCPRPSPNAYSHTALPQALTPGDRADDPVCVCVCCRACGPPPG